MLARLGTEGGSEAARTGYVVPIWSTQSGDKLFELHTEANDAAFSADNRQLAVGFSDMQQALSVWSLQPGADDAEEPIGPGPEPRQDKVEENGHYQGKTAAEFIEKFQPTWGEATHGIEYGIALTKPRQQYSLGERVPLVVFFRNASDKPLKIDMRPDYFGNTPLVSDASGVAVQFENIALLGHISHYVQNLEPGEAVGPFYLSFGLGENPRPGKQHWYPYYKAPTPGKYQLKHVVTLGFSGANQEQPPETAQVSSGTLAFEIVEGR
jgi:hypothetical protein